MKSKSAGTHSRGEKDGRDGRDGKTEGGVRYDKVTSGYGTLVIMTWNPVGGLRDDDPVSLSLP